MQSSALVITAALAASPVPFWFNIILWAIFIGVWVWIVRGDGTPE